MATNSNGYALPQGNCIEHEIGAFVVLSVFASHGNWWHTVLYRHVWETPGGPNSEMVHVSTCMGDEPDINTVNELIDAAKRAIPSHLSTD